MNKLRLSTFRQNWVMGLGWAIFVVLLVSLLAGRYIFDPFIFGFAYYVLFVLSRSLQNKDATNAIFRNRLIYVSGISLLYLWFALSDGVQKRQFVKRFENTCHSGRYSNEPTVNRLCEEIQSHIDNYLYRPVDDYDESMR